MKKINIDKQWLINELETKTVTEIAKKLKITAYTLRRKIKENNITEYKTKGKSIIFPNKQILENELKLKSVKELAKKYNVCVEYFRQYIRKIGIKRSRHEHLINEDFFKNINSDSAYILGFLFADGSINTSLHHNQLCIQINKNDIEIINFIKEKIQPSSKIYIYDRINKKTKNQYSVAHVTFSSKKLIKDLTDMGCVKNKTYKEIKVPNISQEFYADFIRGVFDGDGSIYITKDNKKFGCYICCSSISFIKDLQSMLGFGKINTKDYPFRITFNNKKDIKKFFDYIYNGNFYLIRKFKKFKEVFKKYE